MVNVKRFDFFDEKRLTSLAYSPGTTYQDSTKPPSIQSALLSGKLSMGQTVPVEVPFTPQVAPYIVNSYVNATYVQDTL